MNISLFKQEINNKKKYLYLWIGFLVLSLMISFIIAHDSSLEYRYSTFYFCYILITTVAYGLVLFSTTLMQFDFMHSKPKLDFYHNLPISRKALFLTKYTTQIAIFTIPYVIGGLLAFLYGLYLSTFSPYVMTIDRIHMLYLLLIYTTISLVCYSFLILIGTLTGRTIYQVILFVQTIIFAIFFPLFSISILQQIVNPGISIEPILLLIFGNFSELTNLNILIICGLLLASLFTVLSIRFYNSYKSENASNFLSPTLSKIYIILTSFFIGIIFTASIIMIFNLANIYIESLLILLTISLFSYVVLNIILYKKINFNIKSILILVILCISFILVTVVDILNLNNKTPNINSIHYAYLNDANVSDFESLIELQKLVSKNSLSYYSSHENYYSYDYLSNGLSSEYINAINNSYFPVCFNYTLGSENNPLYFRRNYIVSTSCTDVIDALSDFYTSEEYKESVINNLEQYKADYKNTEIYLDTGIYSLNLSNSIEVSDLIDCLITDISNDDSFGYYNEQPITLFYLDIYSNNYSNATFNLNSNYTNTLTYLDNEYKLEYGDDTSILDTLSIRVLNDDIQPIIDYSNANGIEYVNSSLMPSNSYDDVYEYSNPDDREMIFELLQTPIYTTPYNSIVKLNRDTPYFYIYTNY